MPVKINEFPSNAELARIKTLGKYRKLNNNNQLEVLSIHELIKKQYKTLADMVYLAHAIPGRITEFYGDFVQGDVDRMIISAPTDAQADNKWVENVVFENDLKEKVSDYGEDQSEYGFCVLLDTLTKTETTSCRMYPQTNTSHKPTALWFLLLIEKTLRVATANNYFYMCSTTSWRMENVSSTIKHSGLAQMV